MNKQRVRLALACAVVAMAPVSGALADDVAEGFYFGASLGQSSADIGSKSAFDTSLGVPVSSELDDTGDAWGVQIGYRFNNYVGMEVGYVNLGQADYVASITGTDEVVSRRFESSGPTLSAVGFFPVGSFDIHARAGIIYADTRVRDRDELTTTGEFLSIEAKSSSTDLMAGVGAAWNIGQNFALRVEYTKYFDVGDEDQTGERDVDVVSFGVLFR
jgi:OmpA-OmpF porin, OOP family